MLATIEEQTPVFQDKGHFEPYIEKNTPSYFARSVFIMSNFFGLFTDAATEILKQRRAQQAPFQLRFFFLSLITSFLSVFKSRRYKKLSFSQQLSKRLTNMGPAYIKLGQILALRTDFLDEEVTKELSRLYDKSSVIDGDRYFELVQENLQQPVKKVFSKIIKTPLASASIAQVHYAVLASGEQVVIKLLKPGVRKLVALDCRIIKRIGFYLNFLFPTYQPKAVFNEVAIATQNETDLTKELSNIEQFRKNFEESEQVGFPKPYQTYSNENMLVLEYIEGFKPSEYVKKQTVSRETRAHIADIGIGALIQMFFKDGFFHADLHPGNLLILNDNQCVFIDMGMVGKFDESTRHNLLLYNNALANNNFEAAARYMSKIAKAQPNANIEAYQKAFVETAKNYREQASFNTFSIAKLIMKTTHLGAKYGLYYPMELILMSKALITFEGVGQQVFPDLDVVKISKNHLRKCAIEEVEPHKILQATLENAPELFEIVTKSPSMALAFLQHLESKKRNN